MKYLPETPNALVLRTDFSDDAAWDSLCAAIRKPVGEFRAYVECTSDVDYEGIKPDQILALIRPGSYRSFIFIADATTFSHPEHPILVVDLYAEPGRTFRVIPSEMWSVENNLSIANMDFAEFADAANPDGVFRGFPGP